MCFAMIFFLGKLSTVSLLMSRSSIYSIRSSCTCQSCFYFHHILLPSSLVLFFSLPHHLSFYHTALVSICVIFLSNGTMLTTPMTLIFSPFNPFTCLIISLSSSFLDIFLLAKAKMEKYKLDLHYS